LTKFAVEGKIFAGVVFSGCVDFAFVLLMVLAGVIGVEAFVVVVAEVDEEGDGLANVGVAVKLVDSKVDGVGVGVDGREEALETVFTAG